jgi:hypothetical protein
LTQSLGDGASNNVFTCPKGALYCVAQSGGSGPTGKRITWIERR